MAAGMATTIRFRSLLDIAPAQVEPLPLYTRGAFDPETASIISSAPSYRSEAPSYHPHQQNPSLILPDTSSSQSPIRNRAIEQPLDRLPSVEAAPTALNPDFVNQNYNIASWSSVHGSGTARQYENVARRRMDRENSLPYNSLNSAILSSVSEFSTFPAGPSSSIMASSPAAPSPVSIPQSSTATPHMKDIPNNPFEDPELVGEEAAARAKSQRLYREECRRLDNVLVTENKAWDFMLGQMSDWDERERSWNKFREDVVGRGRKGRGFRLGFWRFR